MTNLRVKALVASETLLPNHWYHAVLLEGGPTLMAETPSLALERFRLRSFRTNEEGRPMLAGEA